MFKYDQAVIKESDEEWSVDWDFFKNHFKAGFPLENANKLIHAQVFLNKINQTQQLEIFQTTDDPTFAPTQKISKQITEMQYEGTDAEISYYESGHLCIVPTIPMVHSKGFDIKSLNRSHCGLKFSTKRYFFIFSPY